MRVRILRNILVEVEKTKLQEVWDKQLRRWDELNVEKADVQGKAVNLTTYDGDIFMNIPVDAYQVIA